MPHGGPHNDGFSYSIDPDLEGDFMGQYGQALGQLTLEAPRLLERSAARERQALEQRERSGLGLLAERAAQARAAAMGGAGQMAGGGGRAASLRQGGLSFGRQAADFAADAFQRAAGLEADITNRRMQMMGETIPGALLGQYEAAQSPQDELINAMNQVGTIEANFDDRASRINAVYRLAMSPSTSDEARKFYIGALRSYGVMQAPGIGSTEVV